MNRSEALIRALWMVDNHLLAKHIDQNDLKLGILARMETYRYIDERTARDEAGRILQAPLSLMANSRLLNAEIFELHQGLPTIRFNPLSQILCRIVDPDSLVCLHEGLHLPDDEGYNWAALAIRDGHFSNCVLNQGSVDTHIHLGGTLPPLFYWLILMSGDVPVNVVSDFAQKRRGYADARQWTRVISAAIWARLCLARVAQALTANQAFPYLPKADARQWCVFDPDTKQTHSFAKVRDTIAAFTAKQQRYVGISQRYWPFLDPLRIACSNTGPCHYAQGERRLLVALAQLLQTGGDPSDLEAQLLAYLRAKNAFHQLLIHEQGSEGLMRFMENFSRRGFYYGSAQHRKRQGRVLLNLERSRMTAALDSQLREAFQFEKQQSSHLMPIRRIEMRVSLSENKRCLRIIHAWLAGIVQHVTAQAWQPTTTTKVAKPGFLYPSQVGLVFHLIKYAPKAHESERILAEKAAHSARKLAGLLKDYAQLRALIVGFDVAGDERNSPPRQFIKAYQQLQASQQKLRPKAGHLPIQLGWTYHVGEDYADLVTGLRHIDEVCSVLFPHNEGRLGHALALADSAERFYARRLNQVELSVGTHLLDLIWARGRLTEARCTADIPWLDDQLAQHLGSRQHAAKFNLCYQEMGLTRSDRHLLEGELLKKLGFLGDSSKRVSLNADAQWLQLCGQLQQLLRQRLAFMQLCVEANPTSNLIIGGFANYGDLPYQILVNDGLAVSLNTDDPGLFISSLPWEFSAMYKALADQRQLSHRDILNWLNARVFDARQSSFLGNHVPISLNSLRGMFHFDGG